MMNVEVGTRKPGCGSTTSKGNASGAEIIKKWTALGPKIRKWEGFLIAAVYRGNFFAGK